jgi:hypothetical protein
MIAALVAGAGLLLWLVSARRAETPGLPASQPGARALSVPPDAPEHAEDEITGDEKADLERIIKNGGTASQNGGTASQNGGTASQNRGAASGH